MTTTLGDVADYINGAAFKQSDWKSEGRRIIRIQNLNDPHKPYNRTNLDVKDSVVVRPGDLLVSWSASLGVYEWAGPDEAVLNQHIFRVVPRTDLVDKRYLRRVLEWSIEELSDQTHGATMKHLTRGVFLGWPIPLPSLEEQKRIAAILDAADNLRTKRRQALTKLDTLTQAIFVDMFGDPVGSSRKGSCVTKSTALGELANIRTGKLDANAAVEGGEFPFFTCAAEPLRIDEVAFDSKAVLVAGNGDLNVKYYEGKFNAYQRTYVVDSRDEDVVDPKFLHGFLDIYVSKLRQEAIGGVIKYIKLGNLTNAQVSLPSREDQLRFGRRTAALQEASVRAQDAHSALGSLFASLQQRAFRGEL